MVRVIATKWIVVGVVVLTPLVLLPAREGTTARGADISHEMGRIKVDQLKEISDVAASRRNANVLWLHNDGHSGNLFALSTTGKLVAVLKCRSAINDLEDIAIGPGPVEGVDYLYLGDIGDNRERRFSVRLLRLAEPELAGPRGQLLLAAGVEEFLLAYPDGPHDAEAMFVDPVTGDVFIVTKEKHRARVYTVPADKLREGGVVKLTAAGKLDVEEVSAGAISFDGRQILLRREKQGWLWNRRPGEPVTAALARKPTKVPVLGKRQGRNGESIGFSPDGRSYYTVSEGKQQPIYRFDLP
jgi:hypothetical protein